MVFLWVATSQVRDLSPLKGLKLRSLRLIETPVTDLSPLEGMPLRDLWFSPAQIKRGMEAVRELETLERVNGMAADEFWRKYDAGDYGT